MTELLLRSELAPLAEQQRRLRLRQRLALCWGGATVLGLGLLGLRYAGAISTTGLGIALAVAAVGCAFFIRSRVAGQQPDFRQIARDIEQRHPDLHTVLLTAVEQGRDPESGRLNFLQERVITGALTEIKKREQLAAVAPRHLFLAQAVHLTALAAFVVVLFNTIEFKREGQSSAAAPLVKVDNRITVTPGDASVERGTPLVVLARFDGTLPTEAVLIITTNGVVTRLPLSKNLNDPVFGATLTEVKGPLTYRVEYAEEKTREFTVTVYEHPRLERADALITYPAYTELSPKRIEDTKRVSAVEGSTVELTLQLNKPVASARLVAKDQSIVPLLVVTNQAQVQLKDFRLETSQKYELQLVDADGRSNKLSAQFVFETLTNQRPILKFIAPRGDQRVSPLQEMLFLAEAQDDYGLRNFGLTYSLGGATPLELTLGSNAPARMKTNFTHLLKLEELHAQPDQLVTYFLWADDLGPDGQLRRTSSDMFFAEVRPFEEIFREGESMNQEESQSQEKQQQQRQNEATKLAELQKQIINATWKLQRQETSAKPSEKYLSDAPVVLESQSRALHMAQAAEAQAEDARAKEALQTAQKFMETAVDQLTKATNSPLPLPQALAAEQAAYQALLKLQARETQVAKAQKGKSGKPQASQRNQAQMDQLDLKQAENRYEKEQQATPEKDAAQKEQAEELNRLKELAQRQQDINEKLKELQTALQEAKTDKEKEDLQRELKRLREEQREMLADLDEMKQKQEQQAQKAEKGSQSQDPQAQQQMEQARQDAQKAAEALDKGAVPQALAAGTRAERELEKLRDEARKKNAGQFSEEMKQMRNEARQLAENQEAIRKQLEEEATKPKSLSDEGGAEKIASELAEQKKAVTNLLNEMRRVTEKSENAEPLLSKQLYETLRKSNQGTLDQSLTAAGELTKRNFLKEAQPFEQRARNEIETLKQDVEKAAESVLGNETEALRAAKRELDQLTEQLAREMARAVATNAAGSNALAAAARGLGTNGAARAASTNAANAQARLGTNAPGMAQRGTNGVAGGAFGTNGAPRLATGGTNAPSGAGQNTNALAGAGGRGTNSSGQELAGAPRPPSEQNPPGGAQPGQPGQPGELGANPSGQPGQGEAKANDPSQQQASAGKPNGEPQPGQPGQPGQKGEGKGEGQDQGQGQQQAQAQNPGKGQPPQTPGQQPGQPGAQPGGQPGKPGQRLSNMFKEQRGDSASQNSNDDNGVLTGEGEFTDWSQRLSNVEEMVDKPQLRNQLEQVRDRARAVRSEYKRVNKTPQWDLVQKDILKPLLEVRDRLADELSRRDSNDSLAPLDRDPVPGRYSDLVRRYYEKLGQGQ